jgi:putative Holliday junction resolvase
MNKVLGLDYGEKRLGFAVSDPGGIFAMPHATVTIHREADALREVVRMCAETASFALVIGLPINMNGTKGPMALKVEAFAEEVRAAVSIPVVLYDERMTTSMVEKVLIAQDMRRDRRKLVRDKLAAQAILQGYLDSVQPPTPRGEEDEAGYDRGP